jgi:hypothetical protein
MNSAFHRFFRLSSLERRMFVRGVLLLPIAACALRFVQMKTVMSWMERFSKERLPFKGNKDEIRDLTETAQRMLEAASRYGVARGNCLSKSIVLCHLLRRTGLPAKLRVGGRKEGPQFAAHAWVEFNGLVIDDSEELHKDFVPFGGTKSGAWINEP